MSRIAALVLCCALFAVPSSLFADPADSVVKVTAFTRFPDPQRPWSKVQPAESRGSGVYIGNKQFITNAHVVLYASELYLQWSQGGSKTEAKLVALSNDLDLALLTVADDKFLDKREGLPRMKQLPRIKDSVTVYGFPIGGAEMSVTKGEVSRINSTNYGNLGQGLVIQSSAPINPGNSGGPGVVAEQMIGIVFSRLNNAQNIGYIIPNEEIDLFLNSIKNGRYIGKPMEGTTTRYQRLENEALRRMLKLEPSVQGVAVINPSEGFPLKEFDILTKIGDHPIDNAGQVEISRGLLVSFLYMVPKLAKDGFVPVTVLRNGKEMPGKIPTTMESPFVIKYYEGDPLPYFIHGPMVFVPARFDDISAIYAKLNPSLEAAGSPLFFSRQKRTKPNAGEELVIVSNFFRHKISTGYASPVTNAVKAVNGTPVKNLRHMVELIRDADGPFLKIEFHETWAEILVFDRAEIERVTEDILEDNGIAPSRRASSDIMELWKAKKK